MPNSKLKQEGGVMLEKLKAASQGLKQMEREAIVNELCELGKCSEAIRFSSKSADKDLAEWDGHGFTVNPFPDGSSNGNGRLFLECHSFIDRSGGFWPHEGAILVHTPEFCAEGIMRAAS